MIAFARLELVKGRLLVAGLVAAFGASLPIAAWAFARWRGNASLGVEAALLFWSVFGLPLCALLIGASSGAAQRSKLSAAAEAPLPLSALRRLGASLFAALIQSAALAAVVTATAAALSPKVRQVLDLAQALAPGQGLERMLAVAALFAFLYGLGASFVCAYGLGHGIAGGVLAGMLTVPLAGSLVWGLVLQQFFGPRASYCLPAAVIATLAAAGLALALWRLAPWVERRSGRAWTAVAIAAAGLLLGLGAARAAHRQLNRRLLYGQFFFSERQRDDWRLFQPALSFSEAARAAAGRGALTSSSRGDLVRVHSDGRREVLVAGPQVKRETDIKVFDSLPHVMSVSYHGDGALWVLRSKADESRKTRTLEVWTGTDAPLSLAFSWSTEGGPKRIGWRGTEPILIDRLTTAFEHRSASIKTRYSRLGRPVGPAWAAVSGDLDDFLLGGGKTEGLVATVERAGGTLRAGARTWKLPGAGSAGESVLGYAVPGGLLYPVRIATADGPALALCGPREVRTVWVGRDVSHDLEPGPDGGLWGRRDKRFWHILTIRGEALAPFDTAPGGGAAGASPEYLRADGRSVWLLAGRELIRARAADGSVEARWRLPRDRGMEGSRERRFWGSAEGLFWHTGRRLFFVDWEGRRRDLGPAWK